MWSVAQPHSCSFGLFPREVRSIAVLAMQEIYNGFKKKRDLSPPAFFNLNVAHSNDKKKKRSLHHLHSLRVGATGLPRPYSKSRRRGEGRGVRLDVAGADHQVKLLYGCVSPVASRGKALTVLSGNHAVSGAGLDAQGG